MAYGLRYTTGFKDETIASRLWELNIRQKNYAGESTEHEEMGEVPAKIVYGEKTKFIFDKPVVMSDMEFSLWASSRFQFANLVDSDAMKNQVELKLAGNTYWMGYIVTDLCKEPIELLSQPVTFKAADFKLLEKFPFSLTGVKSHFEMVLYCLNKLEFGFNVLVNTSIVYPHVPQQMITLLTDDCSIFDGKNCLEVLKAIMKSYGAQVKQKGGKWLVTGIRQKAGAFNYLEYTSNYAYVGEVAWDGLVNTTDNITEEFCDLLAGGMVYKVPPVKQFTIKRTYGRRESMVKNYDFSAWNGAVFDYWQATGTIEQRTREGETYVLIRRTGVTYHTQSKYIRQQITPSLVNSSIQTMILSLKYAVMGGEGTKSAVYIQIKCGNKYYLKLNDSVAGYWTELSNSYVRIAWQAEAESASALTFKTYELKDMPIVSGALEIRLLSPSYMVESDDAKIAGTCFTQVKWQIVDSNGDAYADEVETPYEINANNTYEPDDAIELLFGNKPADLNQNELLIYSNISTPQSTVEYNGKTYATAQDALVAMIKDGYSSPPWMIEAEIQSDIFDIDSVLRDSDMFDARRFIPVWAEFYPQSALWSGDFLQINTDDDITPDFYDPDFKDEDFYDKPDDY